VALTLTEINSYTVPFIVPRTSDTIFKNSPVFTRLQTKQRQRFTGGTQIQRPIIVGELNGDFVNRGEAMNIDFVTTDTALVNNMKLCYVTIALYGYDSMLNDGPEAIFSQVETKFLNASMKMAKLMGTNMYLDGTSTSGRTKYLNGFSEWIDDGNLYPSVGGINRADIVPVGTVGGLNAYTATMTSFQLQTVNSAYGQAWFGADHPDLIPSTQNGWNFIWNALQPSQRYPDPNGDMATTGFQSFRFNAADLVVDKYMPTGTSGVMFLLNTDYIEWYFSTNPKFQFGFTGFKEQVNSIDVAGEFLCGSNIVCPNPRTSAKILSTLF